MPMARPARGNLVQTAAARTGITTSTSSLWPWVSTSATIFIWTAGCSSEATTVTEPMTILALGGTAAIGHRINYFDPELITLTRNTIMKSIISITLALLLLAFTVHAQPYTIDWFKVAGGGGASSNGQYRLTGTIGQQDAGGPMSGGNYSVTSGFWALISVVQTAGLPSLAITFAGPHSVVVSWPDTGVYILQHSSNLAPASWAASGYAITTANGTNSITITPPTGNLFFRLTSP